MHLSFFLLHSTHKGRDQTVRRWVVCHLDRVSFRAQLDREPLAIGNQPRWTITQSLSNRFVTRIQEDRRDIGAGECYRVYLAVAETVENGARGIDGRDLPVHFGNVHLGHCPQQFAQQPTRLNGLGEQNPLTSTVVRQDFGKPLRIRVVRWHQVRTQVTIGQCGRSRRANCRELRSSKGSRIQAENRESVKE